jgi:deoxyinosine 3'endonuclease (endonuclease V)
MAAITDIERLIARWTEEQEKMARRVVDHDMFEDRQPDDAALLVGGFDISFVTEDPDDVCAGLVVCDRRGRVVHEDFIRTRLTLPYIPGYLGYREVPHYLALLARCPPAKRPDVAMIDGNGILHHRSAGSATQFGLMACMPAIGVAKTLLAVDGLSEYDARADEQKINVREKFRKTCTKRGDILPLVGLSKKIWGTAVNTGAQNPVYVSVGHRISIETAVELTLELSKFMNPEPVRQADIRTRAKLAQKKAAKKQ